MSCIQSILMLSLVVMALVSVIRWFEQTTDAADRRDWSRLMLLVIAPPIVWMFPSRVAAGRPTAVPKHEPARGFGGLPKGGIQEPKEGTATESTAPIPVQSIAPATADDGPPPGTPPEFIGLPKIPPKKPPKTVDPEKLAKLRQKMKEQGMLPDE